MAKTVNEIMNRELLTLRPSDSASDALGYIIAMGVTGAPVVDKQHKPIGLLSLRDVMVRKDGSTVRARMTSPAFVVRADDEIDVAARALAQRQVHRAVVVDGEGRCVGMVSAIDLLCGVLGLPPRHPEAFPHYDQQTGLCWTDDLPFDEASVERLPEGPALLALVQGGANQPEQLGWVEAADEVRDRVRELLSNGDVEHDRLNELLARRESLRMRAAKVDDWTSRAHMLQALVGIIKKS